jgi:hypothetical protein
VTDPVDVRLRRKPGARVVEHSSGVTAYPEPHLVPVLPAGWAPLEANDEDAVLHACDEFADACTLRLGSVWDTASEYRVYCLEDEAWRGIYVATVFKFGHNCRLLAVAHQPAEAAGIAVDFVNWDLAAAGARWRLTLSEE